MTDINDLMQQDPLTYSTDGGELRQIIARFREMRAQFNLGVVGAGNTKPKTGRAKQVASLSEKLDLGKLEF